MSCRGNHLWNLNESLHSRGLVGGLEKNEATQVVMEPFGGGKVPLDG